MISKVLYLAPLLGAALLAQTAGPPRIGIVDFFGIRKANKERIVNALGVKVGDPLPKSKADVEEQIERVENVARARLEAVCCENGGAVLYVGIEEKGSPTFTYREAPLGQVHLHPDIRLRWDLFMNQVGEAARQNKSGEDLSQGHSLMEFAGARAHQREFPVLADAHLATLKQVLRTGEDEVERAIAAYVIAYASKKAAIVDDLQYAMQDPDDGVRANAMRSLAGLAVYAHKNPDSGLRVSPVWFVEQLNSLIWSDRSKAAFALASLTESRQEDTLELVRNRALDSVITMARWQSVGHALPGFILLGRIAGWEEKKIQDAWAATTRIASVDEMLKDLRNRKKN